MIKEIINLTIAIVGFGLVIKWSLKRIEQTPTPRQGSTRTPRRQAASTAPKPRSLFQGAKSVIGFGLFLAGAAVTIFSILDVWVQTFPMIQAPSSDTFNDLPFIVTNPSHVFSMRDVVAKCHIVSSPYQNGAVPRIHADVTSNIAVTIAPGRWRILPCIIPEMLITRGDGTQITVPAASATVSVTLSFKTKFIISFDRNSDPASFGWATAPTGKHFWAPTN
jgi:hypothetical protein